jgi:hypothetical protein
MGNLYLKNKRKIEKNKNDMNVKGGLFGSGTSWRGEDNGR